MDPRMLFDLDRRLDQFHQKSGWELSLPARIVLQQAFLSLETDHLGLPGYTQGENRQKILGQVLNSVDEFLMRLTHKASDAVKRQNLTSKEEKLIGAIYVMQNMKVLADLIQCECWPG